jgi:bacteriorhodopsin
MVKYDPLKDRSEACGWKKVQDETPPSEAEQAAWARYTMWFVVVFCLVTMFVFMDKP